MPDVAAVYQAPATPVHPPAISLSDSWPWLVFGGALLLLAYLVAADQGAASLVPGGGLHEWMHDGRHLLGFPCH